MARTIYHDETCRRCGVVIPAGSQMKPCSGGYTHPGFRCPEPVRPAYSTRQVVLAGSVEVGQSVAGLRVVSLGKSWTLDNEDNAVYGVRPNQNARVQYAYLAEV